MNQRILLRCLYAVVMFQISVLIVEYGGAVYPLWTGQEIKLKTIPIDPRSMFRGNYARLRYQIGTIPAKDIDTIRAPRHGEPVYVGLKPGKNGIYVYDRAYLERPPDAVYIRGRIQAQNRRDTSSRYPVLYGIEAFFAPKEKALQLEKTMRQGGIAMVMIAGNGKATLKDVLSL